MRRFNSLAILFLIIAIAFGAFGYYQSRKASEQSKVIEQLQIELAEQRTQLEHAKQIAEQNKLEAVRQKAIADEMARMTSESK